MVLLYQGHAESDGSNEWEYDRNTRLVTPVGSPANIYSTIVNVLGDNGLEQGDSLDVTRGMLARASSYNLFFINGDLSYARCASGMCFELCCFRSELSAAGLLSRAVNDCAHTVVIAPPAEGVTDGQGMLD